MSIARWPAKNAKVRKDLNILRAVPVLLIKVLTDLENLRTALFYRHLGPHGPKESPPPPEPLRRTQTALILQILSILQILLQTTERRATIKPGARLAGCEQHPKRSLLQVWQTCVSIEYAVRVSPL